MAEIQLRNVGKRWGSFVGVHNFDLTIADREFLVLLGPSGCGKTTTGRAVLRLIEAASGKIVFDGHDLRTLSESAMRRLRPHMQIVFQDPYASLNPRLQAPM